VSDRAKAYLRLFEARKEIVEEESQSSESQLQESQPPEGQPPRPVEARREDRLPESQPEQSQPPRSQPPESQSPGGQLNFLAGLPDIRGHLEYPYQLIDHLLRHLDVWEQAVYVQLYRLAWGFKSNRCLISNDRLAERSNVSVTKVKTATASLAGKGLIRKLDRPHGVKVVQGVEYEVFAPSWQLHRSRLSESQPRESQPSDAPNKEKTYKANDKAEAMCPDCFNTGFWYPEGTEKGVARCRHERIR
jgi:hypothetical protein